MEKNELEKLVNNALGKLPFTNGGMFPPSRYYRLLYELALFKKPKVSVVLGVCGGGCCGNLLQANSGKVIGIDVDIKSYEKNLNYLRTYDNFEMWHGDSVDLAKMIHDLNGDIDILFIDTIHTYERTMAEFKAWEHCLADDAVVLLDDLHRDGMLDAWDELPGEKYREDRLHEGGSPTDGGFGIIYNVRK